MSSSPDNEGTHLQRRPSVRATKPLPASFSPDVPSGIHTTDQYPSTLKGYSAFPDTTGRASALPKQGNGFQTSQHHSVVSPRSTKPLTRPLPMPGMTRSLSAPLAKETSMRTSGHLPIPTNRTRVLPGQPGSADRSLTSTRPLMVIPASQSRRPKAIAAPPVRRPRRPIVLSTILLSSAMMLLFSLLVFRPLDTGSMSQSISKAITTFFAGNQPGSLNPARHLITPSPIPPSLIDEGSCGDSSIWGTCAGETTISGVIGTGKMENPMPGTIVTQEFGLPEYQYWCGCIRPHSGIDLAGPHGTPILAADSGEVIWVGWDGTGLGYGVKISHGNYIATIYGHLYRYVVQVGSVVQKGEVIGYEGNTGQSTGPHLHFMLLIYNRWVEPRGHIQFPAS